MNIIQLRRLPAVVLFLAMTLPGRAAAGDVVSVPATATTPQIPAYVALPDGTGKAPGVLVLHACEGYEPHYAHIADWLARHGYVGVAIDTLTPHAVSNACTDATGQATVEAQDARATLAWMRTQPEIDGSHLGVVGYSMGAIAIFNLVDSAGTPAPIGLMAAVAYYPFCIGSDPAAVHIPIHILDGDADDWAPSAPCQAFANAANSHGARVWITTYPGAMHAFNFDAPARTEYGHHLAYDADAAMDAAVQTLGYFRHYLKASP